MSIFTKTEATDPIALFNQAAVDLGVIAPGGKLAGNVIDLCTVVVTMCADIADASPNHDPQGTTVGDAIRARLYKR